MGIATGGLPALGAYGSLVAAVATVPSGDIILQFWELGSAGTDWMPVSTTSFERTTSVAPAVTFNPLDNGRMWIVITSTDDNIYRTIFNPQVGIFGDWTQIGGLQSHVSPALTLRNDGATNGFPVLLATGAADNLVYYNTDPPYAEEWKAITPGWVTTFAPAGALVGAGSYLFVAITTFNFADPNLLLELNQGNPFSDSFVGFRSLDFDTRVSPAMSSAGDRTVIVAVDLEGHVRYNWWDLGQGGHGWIPIGDDLATSVAPAVAVVENGDYMFVMAQGSDGELRLNQGIVGGEFVGWR